MIHWFAGLGPAACWPCAACHTDVALFIFREEYYLKNKEPRLGSEESRRARCASEMPPVSSM